MVFDAKQTTLDYCQLSFFKKILSDVSADTVKTGRPFELYRNSLEVTESSLEEEIATAIGGHVVIQVINHGGFIPPIIQIQRLFTLDEFCQWIYKRSKVLFSECVENLLYCKRVEVFKN
ncbi:MAG: hypothetical protein M3530_09855 [Thermoproteota archaeon]|nr:hypothetical protein [Thermoproteota archaeon]